MKSFNGLFQRMTEPEEIEAAIVEAAKGKTKHRRVARTLGKIKEAASTIRARLLSGEWQPPQHRKRRLWEGGHKKQREIEKPFLV